MKQVYRVLAFLIAAGVALQAASIAYGMFGLIKWIEEGGTLDQSTQLTPALGGYTGFSWHATGGIFVLSVISLLFLISSFFAKVPGGIRWALIVFGVTVLQVALLTSFSMFEKLWEAKPKAVTQPTSRFRGTGSSW